MVFHGLASVLGSFCGTWFSKLYEGFHVVAILSFVASCSRVFQVYLVFQGVQRFPRFCHFVNCCKVLNGIPWPSKCSSVFQEYQVFPGVRGVECFCNFAFVVRC